jgi:3-isopropylmalate/(R)-2-methylmalate dehydratase small subunit
MNTIEGRVWKFGDDVNTDLIVPGRYMNSSLSEMRKHVLETVSPRFPGEVQSGDVIVGGHNFGCGSSREEAPAVLQSCGVSAVIAESFARIFFRNAIAIGLPVITCGGVSQAFKEGDVITLDMDAAAVAGAGTILRCEALSSEMKDMLVKGGILPVLKEIAAGQNR